MNREEELIPPEHMQVYINEFGCVVMSLSTLKAIIKEDIAEQMFLNKIERRLRQYGRLDEKGE